MTETNSKSVKDLIMQFVLTTTELAK